MKVSNNALNFLLAQYRAIFKRAYVKGLASAVLLTAGLAAGQAQADAITNDNAATILGSGMVEVTGSASDKFNISGELTTSWDATVTITSGALGGTGNHIQAKNGNVEITGSGSLTINTGENAAATNGLKVSGGTNGTASNVYTTNINIGSIDVTKGTLAIAGAASGGVTVAARDITVGSEAGSGEGFITLTSAADNYNAVLGADNSQITVYSDGQINLSGGSAGATEVTGQSLNLLGGLVKFTNGSGTISAVDLSVNKDSYLIVENGTDDTKGFFTGKTAKVNGKVLVASGASLDINTVLPKNDGTDIEGQGIVTLGATSNTQIGGTLTVNQGTLVVEDYASLHAGHASGSIAIKTTAGAESATTLQITSDTLKAYLDGGKDVTTVEASVSTGTGTSTTGKFSVSGGVIEFTDDDIVDLANDFKFSGTSGAINAESLSTIKADKLAVYKALTKNATGTITDAKDKIKLVVGDLYLGKSDLATASEGDLGFSGATARNLYGAAQDGTLTLGNPVTLDVTLGDKNVNELANKKGVISGSFFLKESTKPLAVEHGDYTLEGSITVSGGELKVTNADRKELGNLDTTLTIGKGNTLALEAGSASKLTIDGGDAPATVKTVLDIRDATFTVKSGATTAVTVDVKNNGTLWLTGDQLQNQLLKTYATNKGANVLVNDGTILVEGDIELSGNKLASGNTATSDGIVYFNEDNGGTLQVNGDLAIGGITKSVKIGAQGKVVAESLSFTHNTSGSAAVLAEGQFTALKTLTSKDAAGITVSGAQVFLGAIEGAGTSTDPYNALSTGGTIGTKLTSNAATSAINIEAGNWRSSNAIEITNGKLTVGSLDNNGVAKTDAQGNAITAGLTASSLTLGAADAATVTQVGTLTVETLNATVADALNVQGTATINGKYDNNKTTDVTTDDKYGVELAAGSVNVGVGGKVILGADATSAITVSKDANPNAGASANKYVTVADDTFTGKVFSVESAGEVQFSFGEDVIFNQDSIAELRNTLFDYDTQKGVIDGFINLGDAQIAGLAVAEDGTVAWGTLKGYTDIIADVTTQDLAEAKVTGITDGANVRGNLGSLVVSNDFTGETVAIDGNLTLNNAASNSGNFVGTAAGTVLGLDVNTPADVVLNNGGNIGAITFSEADSSLTVNSAQGTTKIASINGSEADVSFTTGTATVTGATTAATISTAAGSNTTFTGVVTVGEDAAADTKSTLAGTTTFENTASFANDAVVAGDATFKGNATFAADAQVDSTGTASFAGDVTFQGSALLNGDTTVDGTATAQNGLTVDQGANVVITTLETSGNVFVGSVTANGHEGATGTLSVETLRLNDNNLVVDPDWNNADGLAFVGVNQFSDGTPDDGDAGILQGKAFALQNSILSIGNKNKDEVLDIFGKYINAQGNLSDDKDGVGAIVYVADNVEVATGGQIVADKTQNKNSYGSVTYYGTNGVFIGDNSVLGVEVSAATGAEAAITFADQNVTVAASDSGKIVLTGDYDQSDRINLMADAGDGTVTVANNDTITVETINGLLTYEFDGQAFNINDMKVETKRAESAFSATSSPVHNSLVAYGTGNTDWRHDATQTAEEKQATKTHGGAASGIVFFNNGYYYASRVEGQDPTDPVVDTDVLNELTTILVPNPAYDPDNTRPNAEPEYLTQVVYKAYNPLLSAINNVQANSGISAESAARMADFAGVAQVALKAGNSTSDAISGRMGMGAQNSAITYANNGQGAGLWVTPIYMNSDSDGFEAQGISYGTDINLYGVALGGDYTLANGIRVGAMFNVGSGDVDGQGAGSNVSSDFDYYGFGLYAGYTMGQFSIVGDLSYTAVDNDVEANTEFADIGKLETSLDSSNISLGVTGAYAFDTAAGVKVTPHVGLRYSYIDIDDYTVDSKAGAIGSYSADSLSVFSIPVGVTIASEFNAGSWSVKPSFDITLTGNFGDDENEGTFHWNGVENIDCGLNSEIFDNFTYGATLGVAAQSASGISLGLSVGYTGSSNVDDFGVNANARFTF